MPQETEEKHKLFISGMKERHHYRLESHEKDKEI